MTFLAFHPHKLLKNAHIQTIVGCYHSPCPNPLSQSVPILLEDGDKIALEISTPKNWKQSSATVILIHGLAGSHESSYLKRLAHKMIDCGVKVIRMNLRGSGSGIGLAKKSYHGGLGSDIEEVIRYLKKTFSHSPLTVVGFSLGGNIALKLACENARLESNLEQIIAICPAIHLKETSLKFQRWPYQFYSRSFLKHLKRLATMDCQLFPDELKKIASECRTMYEFDDRFTAPLWGFKNAEDYYQQASSLFYLPSIRVPCKILFALDDPLINGSVINPADLHSNVQLFYTKQGGHMGFLGDTRHGSFRWMDTLILKWLGLQ